MIVIWTAQDKQKKKKDEKYLRSRKIHFTMVLGKIYIFAGFAGHILELRKREPTYLKLSTVSVCMHNFEEVFPFGSSSTVII